MALTTDRAVADLATYAPEQIGRTRYRTPEGFLFCEGAVIARTGPMLYSVEEMPTIEPGPFGKMIVVERDADVLFDPDCIASYAGKPVTNDHPPVPVTPENFKEFAVGVILNPRRGEGVEATCLIGDLLITEAQAIADVEAGKVQLSPGYDSDVEQIRPGQARQTKNVGNHTALVDRARGGPGMHIKDSEQEEPPMATRNTRRLLDGIRKAFKNRDEAALEENLGKAEEVMDDEEDGDGDGKTVVIKIEGAAPAAAAESIDEGGEGEGGKEDPYEARFKALEDCVGSMKDAFEGLKTALAGSGTQDGESDGDGEKKKEGEGDDDQTTDEEAAEEEKEAEKSQVQDAMSKAEILAPGVKLPTKDSATGKITRAAVTDLRRRSLKTALADGKRKPLIEPIVSGRDIDKMRPSEVTMLFDAAAQVTKVANNAGTGARAFDVPQGRMTPAKYQELIQQRRKDGVI
jgi:hypothetical protein